MKTKTKEFDCVEMKRKGAEQVLRETRGMTREEELAYWAQGTEKVLAHQRSLKNARKAEKT